MKYIFNAYFPDGDTFQNQLFNLTEVSASVRA
jgi:hypothetical protein